MRARLLVIVLIVCHWTAEGQNTPAFRQFYFNPYLYNPAFAGTYDFAEVSLFYRQQWLGFNQSPSAGGFSFLYPSQNRVSLGMNFLTQETVALRTTSTQVTFAYRIPITSKQFLFFGLSAVTGYHDLNLDGVNYSNDPTVLSAASNQFYGDANFGLIYQLGGLHFGFALPRLFGQPNFSPQDLVNVRYAQLRNQLYSLKYKFKSGNFSFEPYALYRINRDLYNWWEGAVIVYFKDKIWMGGSYNNTQGLGFFLGMDFKERLQVGYSYELPAPNSEFISTSSHEVHLKIRMGKKRTFRWASKFEKKEPVVVASKIDINNDNVSDTTKTQLPAVSEKARGTIDEPVVVQAAPVGEQVKEEKIVTQPSHPPVQPVLAAGAYVIVGSFGSRDNALAFARKLSTSGITEAHVGLNLDNNMQCVYVFSSYDPDECRRVRDRLRQKELTKSAWVLQVK